LGPSDPGPKLGLHQSIDLLRWSVKARPDQRVITLQEREKVSAAFCFSGMASHYPVYQVNQAIGGVGQSRLVAFGPQFHRGSLHFLNRLNLSHNRPQADDRTVRNGSLSGGYCKSWVTKVLWITKTESGTFRLMHACPQSQSRQALQVARLRHLPLGTWGARRTATTQNPLRLTSRLESPSEAIETQLEGGAVAAR
jgi:hypothetical protein